MREINTKHVDALKELEKLKIISFSWVPNDTCYVSFKTFSDLCKALNIPIPDVTKDTPDLTSKS